MPEASPEAPRREKSQPREGREPEPLLARLQKVMERVDDFRSRPPDEFVERCEDPEALRWVVDNYPTCIALFARILARAAIKRQATAGTPEAFARGLGDAERADIVETFPSCIEFLQSVVNELQRPRPSADGRAPRPRILPARTDVVGRKLLPDPMSAGDARVRQPALDRSGRR